MVKLVITDNSGLQQLLIIHETGHHNDLSKVLWDERINGPLPSNIEAKIGGLVKDSQGNVTIDETKYQNQQNILSQAAAKEAARIQRLIDARAVIASINDTDPLPTDLKPILKALVFLVRNG